MSRALVWICLLVAAAALTAAGSVHRYEYFSVIGPSSNVQAYAQTDQRRVDRWTGSVEVWACQDVDTQQTAAVPDPPKSSDYGTPDATDAVRTAGQYFLALSAWRKAFPRVNPDTLHVMKTVCSWETAR